MFPFTLKEIQKDGSRGKLTSHGRLTAFIDRHDNTALCRAYKKQELDGLLEAYDTKWPSRANKSAKAVLLRQAIRINNSMPKPQMLATVNRNLSVEQVGDAGTVLRFRLT